MLLYINKEGTKKPMKRYTKEQILQSLTQGEREKVTEIRRELGISEQTFYNWKRKCAGMGLSEPRELQNNRDQQDPPRMRLRE